MTVYLILVGNSLMSLITSHFVVMHPAMLQFERKLQKCTRMGITIFKFFISGGISSDIRSEF